MTDPDTASDDDTALAILRQIAERLDDDGLVRLHESELPFFLTTEGTQWLEQVSLGDDAYRITEHGARALGLAKR